MVYINLYQYLENKVAADKIAQCPYRHTNEWHTVSTAYIKHWKYFIGSLSSLDGLY
jgi:hypothetical protein